MLINRRTFWGICFVMTIANQAFAQGGDIAWSRTFEENPDEFKSIHSTPDKGWLIAGNSTVPSSPDADAVTQGLLLKTDSTGVLAWSMTFGDSGYNYFNSAVINPLGHAFAVGHFGENNGWIVKVDSDGDELWTQTFPGSNWQTTFTDVNLTSDGGVLAVGALDGEGWLLKIDAGGNELWSRTYGGVENDRFNAVQSTEDGGWLLLGNRGALGWLAKVDSLGNEIWNRTLGNAFKAIQPVDGGGWIVCGSGQIIKIDSNGNTIWHQILDSTNSLWLNSIQPANSDGWIIAGEYWDDLSMGSGGILMKLDTDGNELWRHTFSSDSIRTFEGLRPHTNTGWMAVSNDFTHGSLVRIREEGPQITSILPGNAQVQLSWLRTSSLPTKYYIYRSTDGVEFTRIDSVIGNPPDTMFVDTNLLNGVQYSYRLTSAVGSHLESSFSNMVVATPTPGRITIPSDFPTIQGGIDAAVDGDTILIQPGTYFENINFNGKNIVVGSQFLITQDTSYISQTVIDGNQNGSVVTFENAESNETILTGITIQNGNKMGEHGGGIYCNNSSPQLDHLIICGNSARYGAGIDIFASQNTPVITNSVITDNIAEYSGGGIQLSGNASITTQIANCLIKHNSVTASGWGGGALYASVSNATLINCTIVENESSGIGSALASWDYSLVKLINSIIYNNENNESSNQLGSNSDGRFELLFTLIGGGWPGFSNINTNPMFVNPSDGDYHLMDYSPAIGAGIDSAIVPNVDIFGFQRPMPINSDPDLGALENQFGTPQHIPTTLNVPSEYATIQTALNAADSTDTVLVDPGTYYENILWPQIDGITLRSAGLAENTTIHGSGSGTVLFLLGLTNDLTRATSIEGFTITGGNATAGGGISLDNASPILRNLVVTENTASSAAGINCINGSNPILSECIITDNIAGADAGGMHLHMSNVTMHNTLIRGNHSGSRGGGIFIADGGGVKGSGIFIIENTTGGDGGGIYTVQAGGVLDSVHVVGNVATTGGGIYSTSCDIEIKQVNLTGNIASQNGGAAFIWGTRTSFSELNVWNNYSGAGCNGIQLGTDQYTAVTNSNIFNNGTGVVSDRNWDATNNWWGAETGPFHAIENPAGTGDTASFYLSVEPWLAEPNTTPPPITVNNVAVISSGEDNMTLSWDPSPLNDFAGFKLYYDTDESGYPFNSSVDIGTDTSYTLANLNLGTEYFIAVTVYDTDGNESWYSNEVTGKTRVMEVQNLDIAGDEDLQHLMTHDPLITFEYFDNMSEPQTHYQIQVSTHDDFNIIDMWETGEISGDQLVTQYNGEPLQDGQSYSLRARVASGEFWSDWSELTFRMNSEPGPPTQLSLIENEVTTGTVNLVIGNSLDPEGDELSYDFRLYNDATLTNRLDSAISVPAGPDETTWEVQISLDDNAQHWWTVQAYDGYEYSPVVGPETFIVNYQNDAPGAFTLLSPANGSNSISLTPLLSWAPSFDPDPLDTVNYTLYLDTPEPGVETFNVGIDTSYQITTNLLDNTRYFWKVVAHDLNGAATESIGGYHNFQVNTANDPPTDFALLTPENGSMVADLTPTLMWEPSSDPDDSAVLLRQIKPAGLIKTHSSDDTRVITGYWVYLGTDSSFTEVTPNEVMQTSFTPDVNLTENAVYYWKVEAQDDLGAILSSGTYSFWTNSVNSPPTELNLLTPAAGIQTDQAPVFSWTAATDPDMNDIVTYEIRYSSDPTNLISTSLGSALTFTPDPILTDNMLYYWQIDGMDQSGATITTPLRTFFVNSTNENPNSFDLVSPLNASVSTDSNILFAWNPTLDLDGNQLEYIIYMGSNPEDLIEIDTVSVNYLQANQLSEGMIYWQVEAVDGLGGATISEIWSVLVNAHNDVPAAFDLIIPENSSVVSTTLPTFVWESTTDPDYGDQLTYQLELGISADNLAIVYTGTDTVFTAETDLSDNSTYYWRVTAKDLSGATMPNSTGYQHFTVNTSNDPPVAFNLLSPVDNAMVTDLQPTFLWQESSDPDDQPVTMRIGGKNLPTVAPGTQRQIRTITGYEFYLGLESNLSDAVAVEVAGTSYVPAEDLIENTVYYWAITALDDSGGVTSSDTASFWTNSQNEIPTAFGLISPINGETFDDDIVYPTFIWHPSSDADLNDSIQYQLMLGLESPFVGYTGTDTSWTANFDFSQNTIYHWTVNAIDQSGAVVQNIGGMTNFIMNIGNDAPWSRTLITPTQNSVEVTLTPEFYWEESFDPDPLDVLTYTLWLSQDSLFTTSDQYSTTEHEFTLTTPLADNGEYFWKVETTDSSEANDFSNFIRFWTNTILEPPNAFELLSPPNLAQGLGQSPVFSWQEATDNDPRDYSVYQLVIATDSTFTAIAQSIGGITDTSFISSFELPVDTQYWWKVIAMDTDSLMTESSVNIFTVGYVSTHLEAALPTEYTLQPNYPNPFNPSTTIKYGLPEGKQVRLMIYDIRGTEIVSLVNQHQSPGWYEAVWNGRDTAGNLVGTGIYLVRIQAGQYSQTRKMLLLK